MALTPVSLQTIAFSKVNEASAHVKSNLLHGICAHGHLDFLHVIIHCSPTKLDAAIFIGEKLMNSVLKETNRDKTQREKINVITRNFQASSLLHEVSRRGNVKQLQRLLQNRGNCAQRFFNKRDEEGRTPLMWACRSNSVDVIKFILSSGADLYARDSFGQTPFLHACRGNTREALEFLVRKGARIHDIDSNGQHGIHHAARGNTRDVLELLLQNLQADIHLRDWRNRCPIHHASAAGNAENVLFLIENRSCLNSKTRLIYDRESDDLGKNYGAMTPLHYAAQNGHFNIARLLVQHGANIGDVTDCGRSAFMLATENGYEDIALDFMKELFYVKVLSECRENS